jgi:Fe-S oxidoreductase
VAYIRSGRIRLDRSRYRGVRACYHDPCNYGRKALRQFGRGYFREPRWIMDQCLDAWVDLHPRENLQICCGGGGGAMTTGYDEARVFYGRRKMEQIRTSGAEMVVVPCHSCHGQINAIKGHYGMAGLQVKYLWELVADLLIVE